MKTYGGHDFSFGVLRKTVLEWLLGGEGDPEYPWEADSELLGPLALPPGVLWADGARRTLRWTYVPYEVGVGLADDMNSQPGAFVAARYYRLFVESDGTPFVVEHPLGVFPPLIQLTERIVGVGTEYFLYDLFGAGGSIQFIDEETIVIDPGAAADLFIVLGG